jgi:hypothetical protein
MQDLTPIHGPRSTDDKEDPGEDSWARRPMTVYVISALIH